MDEYVSKAEIKAKMIYYGFYAPDMAVTEFVKDELTAADAPAKYGKWEWHESDYEYECSACGCRFDYNHTFELFDHDFEYANYCPNCGAKMIGGV
jgi:DNA-directed RNA polymerase subunit RPC12/RpoP